jgi:FtsH-binding integral membrane protein
MGDNKLLSKSFLWMCIGLLVTFVTGFGISMNERMLENIFGGSGFWILVILEFVLVIVLSARVMKMNPTTAKICFILYSFVSGLTFSSIFVVYELTSIMMIFLVSAIIFGIMAFVGYTTKVDLSRVGFYLLMALLGVILVSIINIFLGNGTLEIIICIICLLLFIGITAYDVQKIRALESTGLPEDNLAIYGALELYLDFINIFLQILELFAKNKD